MSANETLSDNAIKHAIDLLRFGNGLERDILKLLTAAQENLVERLAARLVRIDERGFDIGPATTSRIETLIGQLRELNTTVYNQIADDLVENLSELSVTEGAFQVAQLKNVLPVAVATPSPARLRALVTTKPLTEGRLLQPFLDGMKEGADQRIEAAIRVGIAQGDTSDQIVRAIRGTRRLNFKDGVAEISRRSARSIVRTSVNSVANNANQAVWSENSELLQGWQFVATLDTRTTTICASNDGRVFDIGSGPVPALHIGCRSISTAVTKSARQLGLSADEFDFETRASIDGQVAASTTFDSWLRNRSQADQDKVLGKTRADLFRNNKLNLQDFIRANREIITLDELRVLQPQAFE